MNRQQLIAQIRSKRSFLCVGLDPDIEKIPAFLREQEDPIYEFCKQIVDSTASYCVAFKPNLAFFEAYGLSGYQSLDKVVRYIKANYPEHFLIADAKRGDIGNTSSMYAKAFFRKLGADAVTIAPYMGEDSVKPFLEFENKWAIVLALTSNKGASDFQTKTAEGKPLYQHVIERCNEWGTESNLMFVVGATQSAILGNIRKMIPGHFLLVPGIGAQGGDLKQVCEAALTSECGLLVNASRSILYAGNGTDFADKAQAEARRIAEEMSKYLN